MSDISTRFKNAWNAFMNRDPPAKQIILSGGYGTRPDRVKLNRGTERSIVAPILNKIALDCSSISIQHVRLDKNKKFISEIDSGLNECLTLSANKDQTGRAFVQDVVLSMFDEGVVAIVPIDTDVNPNDTNSYDILSMRTGKITQWFPDHVRVKVYNDRTGMPEEITMRKDKVAIVENPFYLVMNEPNSTCKRLINALNLSDTIDRENGSGKLDLIVQLPYTIKSSARKAQAEERRKEIEMQLTSSKYGIAYVDATEHITQLNRAVENNLNERVEKLTHSLYSQLSMTEEIMNGTASESTMSNYYSRTVEVILDAIVDAMKRTFLTKTARTQGQSIVYYRDPFKLVPVSALAEMADKFTRNEILSGNELRQIVGYRPVEDERADELRNKNLNPGEDQTFASTNEVKTT